MSDTLPSVVIAPPFASMVFADRETPRWPSIRPLVSIRLPATVTSPARPSIWLEPLRQPRSVVSAEGIVGTVERFGMPKPVHASGYGRFGLGTPASAAAMVRGLLKPTFKRPPV